MKVSQLVLIRTIRFMRTPQHLPLSLESGKLASQNTTAKNSHCRKREKTGRGLQPGASTYSGECLNLHLGPLIEVLPTHSKKILFCRRLHY
jgi:hypothetical protein